ncbi:MAG: cobalamin biosynthesis protein [Actinobacteria bacterium]|nr:cobalamin biosynthesis protein [Actinomycetota bacterium]
MRNQHPLAIVAVSLPGCRLALRLRQSLPESTLYLPERFSPWDEHGVHPWRGRMVELMAELFGEYGSIVVFGSVGMTVRLIAPMVADKHTDPAVVAIDDGGRFAVSLLSGHLGGGNALAERVAALLGAQPVVTTASDTLNTLAVDLLGRELGWRIENVEAVTRVSAAVVNGEEVGLLQEAGEPNWWPDGRPLPSNLPHFSTMDELVAGHCRAALIITDRVLSDTGRLSVPFVVYRARSLVVGIGCNRGTSAEEIEEAVKTAFERNGLALASLRKLATVDVKRDEVGLSECAEKFGVPVEYFPAEALDGVVGAPNPSVVVQEWIGTRGVCEPAALLASGMGALLVPKTKTRNVTVAVARMRFSGPDAP